jgi:hypothetical protein
MSEVKILVLFSGDEVIAKVKQNGHRWHVENPCMLKVVQVPDDSKVETLNESNKSVKFDIILSPLIKPYMKEGPINIDDRLVIYTVDPSDKLVEKYNSLYSSIITSTLNLNPFK